MMSDNATILRFIERLRQHGIDSVLLGSSRQP
jgi:hypothetical protein